jgi:hypothetical protein
MVEGPGPASAPQRSLWYNVEMTSDQVKEILDRVLDWPDDDQEKFVRFVDQIEQYHADDGISDERGERHEISGWQEVIKSN